MATQTQVHVYKSSYNYLEKSESALDELVASQYEEL